MLEYVVKVSWNAEFIFDDSHTAMTFAQLAANRRIGEHDDVTIVILREKENEEEEDNEAD